MSKNKILRVPILKSDERLLPELSFEEIYLGYVDYVLKLKGGAIKVRYKEFIYDQQFKGFIFYLSDFFVDDKTMGMYYHCVSSIIYNKLLKHLEPYIAEVVEITEDDEDQTKIENKKIEELQLQFPPRVYYCLKSENINFIKQLIDMTAKNLLKIPNFGRYSLYEVKRVLKYHGLKLRDD